MKLRLVHLTFILVAALTLSGCVMARKVAFDEGAFVAYRGSGTATIKGTAFTVLRGNKYERDANSNAVVKLVPANAYTKEIVTRRYYNRVKLEQADPRYAKYVRRTHPDGDGHFIFTNMPAGNYYVSCHLRWQVPDSYTDSDGVTWDTTNDVDQWIYAEVSVGKGQTADVEIWNQGK
jgi:hypothetical protein